MAKTISIQNRRTGVKSQIQESVWNDIKDSPQWKGVFKALEKPEPPEVKDIRNRKKEAEAEGNEAKEAKK